MSQTARKRDGECERKERLGFVILQHLLNLWGEESSARWPGELATSLAISRDELMSVLTRLSVEGLVYWAGPRSAVMLTERGAEYRRLAARRRRSVRVFSCMA